MTDYDDLFETATTAESVFADKGALDPLREPDEMVTRDKQVSELAAILGGVEDGYLPATVSIYGPPGTRKTLTTRRLCREFAARNETFTAEYVNLGMIFGLWGAHGFINSELPRKLNRLRPQPSWRQLGAVIGRIDNDPGRSDEGFSPDTLPDDPGIDANEIEQLKKLAGRSRKRLFVIGLVVPPVAAVRVNQYRLALLVAVTMPLSNVPTAVYLYKKVRTVRKRLYAAGISWHPTR